MKIALLALAALAPALASADDRAPYVVHEGRAASPAVSTPAQPAQRASETKRAPAFGTGTLQAGSAPSAVKAAGVGGNNTRSFRSTSRTSRRRGLIGAASAGGVNAPPAPTPASSAALPYATPGAKILTAGQQPTYSDARNAGTLSVEGGGFIAIDQSRANDAGRAPGVAWAPPDTPPSAGAKSGGGGTGASSNGPAAASRSSSAAPPVASNTNRGAQGATGFDASF